MSDRVDNVLCYWQRRRRGGNVLFLRYAIYGGKVAPVQVLARRKITRVKVDFWLI
jgi:hypothetical protein